MRAQFVFHEVWIGLRRNLTMTIALIVVVAISLSLLGTGLLFVKQVDNTRTYWQGRVQLSIYLCTSTSVSPQCTKNGPATPAEIAQLDTDLKQLPEVVSVGTSPRPRHTSGSSRNSPRISPSSARSARAISPTRSR
jgi:cell division transport system permease protein